MSDAASNRAEALFLELVEADEQTRRLRLDRECSGDPDLRAEVESLLNHHDEAGVKFLDSKFVRSMAVRGGEAALATDTRIGGYRILGTLGQGGMGVVYRAEQDRPRRIVALKVIRRASASPSLLKRFEHEAEILGRLQHPGIAQIYEAGQADTGHGPQPFIAMELIQGLSLVEYCRKHRTDWRGRMALVAQVCDAIQHAHQRGIIHRDIKPTNVLVDEQGQPKVLDFGVARSDHADMVTLHTGVGELVGTLPYMSPEQVGGRSDEVDTRTDVYSLGVVLFELLAERLPHDLTGLSLPDAVMRVREDEPAKLSSISRVLRGDIDTVVGKALEKNKARRYQSASDFAADIRRCIAGEPIQAKADSAMYILRKQMRRYRNAVIGAGLSVLVLGGFLVFIYRQSENNARLAASEKQQSTRANILLREISEAEQKAQAELTASRIEQGRLFARAGNLRAAENLIWGEHARSPANPYTYWALAETYSRNPCVRSFRAHADGGRWALATADGGALFTAALEDPVIRCWSIPDGRPMGEIPTGRGSIQCMALDLAAANVAIGRKDGSVEVWNVASRSRTVSACLGDAVVECLSFSPDGRLLLCGLRTGWVRVVSLPAGHVLYSFQAHRGATTTLTFSPDGKLLATTSQDTSVKLWSAATFAPRRTLTLHEDQVLSAAFSPDGSRLATAGGDRMVRLWDVDSGKQLTRLVAPNGTINTLIWMRDGTLYSCGWHSIDGWYPWPITGPRMFRDSTISLSEQSRMLACGLVGEFGAVLRPDGRVSMWRLSGTGQRMDYPGGLDRSSATISPSGRVVVTSDQEGWVRFFDAPTGEPLAAFRAHRGRCRLIKFQPGGTLLATAGSDNFLRLWDMTTGRLVSEFADCHDVSTRTADFSPDGERIAYCGLGNRFWVRRVSTGEELAKTPGSRIEAISIEYSPDGSTLATVRREWFVELRSAATLEVAARLPVPRQPWTTLFSPDGAKLFVCGWHETVMVWDVASRTLDRELEGHFALVPSIACVATGDPNLPLLLASASSDGDVRLWDYRTGRSLASFQPAPGWEAISVAFDAAGRRLVASHSVGGATSWDLTELGRVIAGNAGMQIARQTEQGGTPRGAAKLLEWSERVLSDTSVRPPPPDRFDPAAIREWGRKPGLGVGPINADSIP